MIFTICKQWVDEFFKKIVVLILRITVMLTDLEPTIHWMIKVSIDDLLKPIYDELNTQHLQLLLPNPHPFFLHLHPIRRLNHLLFTKGYDWNVAHVVKPCELYCRQASFQETLFLILLCN